MNIIKKLFSLTMMLLITATSTHGMPSLDLNKRMDQLQQWIKNNPKNARRIYELMGSAAENLANRIKSRLGFKSTQTEIESPFGELSEAERAAQIAALEEFENQAKIVQEELSPFGRLSDAQIAEQKAALEKYRAGERPPVALPMEVEVSAVPIAANVPIAPPITDVPVASPIVAVIDGFLHSAPPPIASEVAIELEVEEPAARDDLLAAIRGARKLKPVGQISQPVVQQSQQGLGLAGALAGEMARRRQRMELEVEEVDDDWDE